MRVIELALAARGMAFSIKSAPLRISLSLQGTLGAPQSAGLRWGLLSLVQSGPRRPLHPINTFLRLYSLVLFSAFLPNLILPLQMAHVQVSEISSLVCIPPTASLSSSFQWAVPHLTSLGFGWPPSNTSCNVRHPLLPPVFSLLWASLPTPAKPFVFHLWPSTTFFSSKRPI